MLRELLAQSFFTDRNQYIFQKNYNPARTSTRSLSGFLRPYIATINDTVATIAGTTRLNIEKGSRLSIANPIARIEIQPAITVTPKLRGSLFLFFILFIMILYILNRPVIRLFQCPDYAKMPDYSAGDPENLSAHQPTDRSAYLQPFSAFFIRISSLQNKIHLLTDTSLALGTCFASF